MSSKPTITTFSGDAKYSTSVLNANFTALKNAFENILGRSGTSGTDNAMTGDLDMAGFTLRNVTFEGDVVGLEWQGAWVTATEYVVNDLVFNADTTYICVVAHTSGTFATDLSAGKWETFAAGGASVTEFAATLLDDATAADARTTLGAQADLDVPSQAEAEAGTATTERVWTAERVKQAIEALAPGSAASVQTFASSGTWTRPAGVTKIIVEIVGPGGGGGGAAAAGSSQASAAGGGGGGGYVKKFIDVSAIASATVTISTGGAGGSAGANSGAAGSAASVWADASNTLTANAGAGGAGGTVGSAIQIKNPGDGGSATGGDINGVGEEGGPGITSPGTQQTRGGEGGGTLFGAGALSRYSGGNGVDAVSKGGGGGGGADLQASGTARSGGAGADGFCIVYEYT